VKVLLFFWQLPQHLLAHALIIIFVIFGKKAVKVEKYKPSPDAHAQTVYWLSGTRWGVSLGSYTFLSEKYTPLTVRHEYGHSIQSMRWGPLYLLVVGLPSITMNILTSAGKLRGTTYYDRWPENEADRLAGIDRKAPPVLAAPAARKEGEPA